VRILEGIDPVPSMARGWTAPAWAVRFAVGLLASSVLLLLLLPPHLFVAAGLAVAIAFILIVHPRAYLALYLATGGLSLAIFASEPGELLKSDSGVQPDSLRLLAFAAGGVLLLFLRPRLLLLVSRHRLGLTFVAALAVSLLYTSGIVEGILLFLKICLPLLTYVLVISEVHTEFQIRGLLHACLIGLASTSLLAVMGVATGGSLFILDAGGISRFQGPMGPNSMAFYCTCFSLLFYSYGTRPARKSWLAIFGAVVMSAVVASTGARVGIAGLLLGILAIEWAREQTGRGCLITAAALIAVAVLSPVFQRFAYSRDIRDLAGLDVGAGFWGILGAVDTSGRDTVWRRVWEDLVITSPVVGHGLGSSDHYLADLLGGLMAPHSELLRLLADTGVVGAALGAALAAQVGTNLLKSHLPRDDPYEFLRPLAIGSFAAFIVFSMTDNALGCYAVFTGYLATFVGLLRARVNQLSDSGDGI